MKSSADLSGLPLCQERQAKVRSTHAADSKVVELAQSIASPRAATAMFSSVHLIVGNIRLMSCTARLYRSVALSRSLQLRVVVRDNG
jgi:hypothetical protein